MSNDPAAPHTATYPTLSVTAASSPARPAAHLSTKAHPAPTPQTDRPTATYPTAPGRRPDPAGYLHPADPRLSQADATPTGAFPIRRSIRPAASDRPQREGAARPARGGGQVDAASLSHGGAGARAVYHTASPSGRAAPSRPLADGRERRQARRRHLRAALTGIALAVAVLTGLQLYALDGINDAREQARAARPRPASAPSYTAPSTEQDAGSAMSGQSSPPMSRQTSDARSGTRPEWVTHDSGAPYSKDDPAASPLDLPRCTTSPDTPMPCLAHVSADSTHAVVLEEDASLTGLVRR